MVALLGLFEQHEVFVQHALLGEGDAVDTGELLTVLVAAPVGTCDGGQLDSLDDLGVAQMRSAAEVGESTVGIIGNGTVFEFADEFALILVALLLEILHCLGLGHLYALEIFLPLGKFEHFLLDLGQVGFGKGGAGEVDIIVEAVLDSGSDAELHTGIEALEGLCHKVGR